MTTTAWTDSKCVIAKGPNTKVCETSEDLLLVLFKDFHLNNNANKVNCSNVTNLC